MTVRAKRRMYGAVTFVGLLAAAAVFTGFAARAQDEGFQYDAESAETATYWAAISNLANAIMFSGLGEPVIVSQGERDDWLRRSGYVTRPPMPDLGMVGQVYRAGMPTFTTTPDFAAPETLRWDPRSFDRTLDPGAQAWVLLKITSAEFHLQFHDLKENKLAGLMMIPQAKTQAELLADDLRNAQGLFVPRTAEGRLLEPEPRDQAAVLWALSSAGWAGRLAWIGHLVDDRTLEFAGGD